MSIEVMSAVWKNAPVKGGDLLVLLALADHANERGMCWPSIPTLAEKSRLSERQVYEIIGRLERKKLIDIDRGAGSRRGNFYRVNVSGGEVSSGDEIRAVKGEVCDIRG